MSWSLVVKSGEGAAAAAAMAMAGEEERTRGLFLVELPVWVRIVTGATTDEEDEVEAGAEAGRVSAGGNAAAGVDGGTTTAARWRFALLGTLEKVATLCAGGCTISQVDGIGRFLRPVVVVVVVATVSVGTRT